MKQTKTSKMKTTRSRSPRKPAPKQAHLINELYPDLIARSTRGRQARRKGAEYERVVASVLQKLWPRARRSIGQARQGHEVPDVQGTPFWVECSKGSSIAIMLKMRQALAARELHNSASLGTPYHWSAVFARSETYKLETVTMTQAEFLDLLVHVVDVLNNFT